MKESKLPKRFWLIIAVAMILVSMIGSNLVQSDGGKVKIHKVNLVVADGAELYAQMYIPEQASADHKLPLVIVQHGIQHNLQMQDMNMV